MPVLSVASELDALPIFQSLDFFSGQFFSKKSIDGRIVISGLFKSPNHQFFSQFTTDRPLIFFHFFLDHRILVRLNHDGHALVIFGRRPDHTGAANINILDPVFDAHSGRRGHFFKRVKIANNQINSGNTQFLRLLDVFRLVAFIKQRAFVVKADGFHPAIKIVLFGITGDPGNRRDLDPVVLK